MIDNLMLSADISLANKVPLSGRYVYFILDEDDVIIYIGQTCSPEFRLSAHKLKNEFDYLKMVKVDDSIELCDAEFMAIIKHKPIFNKAIPTPTFLITKSRMTIEDSENKYNTLSPDLHLTVNSKDRYFWLRSQFKGVAYFESLLLLIRRYEKESNANHAMLNRLINELENE